MEPEDAQIAPEKQQEMAQELIQRDGYSEFMRGGVSVQTSQQEEAEYTKRGNVYVVDDARGNFGRYATIGWSERERGFNVQVYEKFSGFDYSLDETVVGEHHIWGSYMLEGKSYEDDRSDYGAMADGRITTVEGLRKTLSQFDISWPKGLSDEISAEINRDEQVIARDGVRTVDLKDQLKDALTKIVYNDMSAIGEEERRIGTADLARETLAGLERGATGVNTDTEMRNLVDALNNIAYGDPRTAPAHQIATEALLGAGAMYGSAMEVKASEWNVSPDDRFQTLDAYEAAVEVMETNGIARVEREGGDSRIHSVDQGVSPERQKTNEVGRGKQGVGVAL